MSYHIPQAHVVHKHQLSPDSRCTITLPTDANIVMFDIQHGSFTIWEYHNTTLPKPQREIDLFIAGTGHEIPGELLIVDHLGSFTANGFVWHLFHVADQSNNLEPKE